MCFYLFTAFFTILHVWLDYWRFSPLLVCWLCMCVYCKDNFIPCSRFTCSICWTDLLHYLCRSTGLIAGLGLREWQSSLIPCIFVSSYIPHSLIHLQLSLIHSWDTLIVWYCWYSLLLLGLRACIAAYGTLLLGSLFISITVSFDCCLDWYDISCQHAFCFSYMLEFFFYRSLMCVNLG